jgi:transcriptional regulator with XRE-family HTH domain
MANLGERIKELRQNRGYTQNEFIQILKDKYNLKADRVMLSKWECNKQCPHIETHFHRDILPAVSSVCD